MKPARLRPSAEQDVIAHTRGYTVQGGTALAARMFDAAQAALEPLARMPGLGSPRIGQLCSVPGLRGWGVHGWPLQWLYLERADHLDVIRLLGDRQDIESILSAEPPPDA